MASSASSAAVAALVQKASQQYLDCRRKVTAKVEEVKALDQEITALFEQITALGEPTGGGAAAKSVGRLEVRIAGVEGETPVENAVITVALDPEYEPDADAFEVVEQQHVVEKHTVTVTAVAADGAEEVVAEKVITFEDGVEVGVEVVKADDADAAAVASVQRRTTTKIARTVQIKKVKRKAEKKEPPVRSVEWTPEAAEGGGAAFPATFVFDPVQSREAVVTITVAAPNEPEAEPVKEIEFPVSALFQGKDLDQWYTIQDRVEEKEEEEETKEGERDDEGDNAEREGEETTITELADEDVVPAAAAVAAEEPAAAAAVTTEEEEEAEGKAVVVQEGEAGEVADEAAPVDAETSAATEVAASAAAPAMVTATRFHVQATFALSQIEALSLEAVNLSKKKQEAEAMLAILEREAASLRTKYERLHASQRSLGMPSVTKPKASLLLGGRGLGSQAAAPKSGFQQLKDSVSAVLTPQRQQVAVSVVMFVGSAVLFHFQGENLLA
ncbi:hypothetical protein PybrP1_007332 [[Pythium] brassicae (nom. inval.)]|nr:hypothetical protein PybrP1_007332 [[Pythium] brassicae (nom. inval.)]